jgi:hypothetical protein
MIKNVQPDFDDHMGCHMQRNPQPPAGLSSVTSSIHFADILLFPSMPYKLTQHM